MENICWRSGPDVPGEIAAWLLRDLLPPVSSRLLHGDNLMRAATGGQIYFGFVNAMDGIDKSHVSPLTCKHTRGVGLQAVAQPSVLHH